MHLPQKIFGNLYLSLRYYLVDVLLSSVLLSEKYFLFTHTQIRFNKKISRTDFLFPLHLSYFEGCFCMFRILRQHHPHLLSSFAFFLFMTFFKAWNCPWMQVQHQLHKASQGFSLPACWDKGFEGTQVSSHSPDVMDPMPRVNRATSGHVVRQIFSRTKELLLQSGSRDEQLGLTGGGQLLVHSFGWSQSNQYVQQLCLLTS